MAKQKIALTASKESIRELHKYTATELLSMAKELISGDRREAYGPAKESFERIACYWSQYIGYTVTSRDVAMMMVLFKVARESNSHKTDNLVDIAGYAALAEECEVDEYGN